MMKKNNEREIILTDKGHYWIRFKGNKPEDHEWIKEKRKESTIGRYNEEKKSFNLIGSPYDYPAYQFDILSDILLRDTEVVPY